MAVTQLMANTFECSFSKSDIQTIDSYINQPLRMLESYKIANCPATAYYIPDFLTSEEEMFLMNRIYNVPKPKWTQLAHRRLQNWGGIPHPNGMVVEPIPEWLQTCMDKVDKYQMFGDHKPNHVLINEYKPGEGIMPHLDGPIYYPTIATVNLGSHTVLNYYRASDEKKSVAFSLFLQPRSLLIQQDEMYNSYLHGIDEKDEDILQDTIVNLSESNSYASDIPLKRGTRISLTIRHVLKTKKFKINLGR